MRGLYRSMRPQALLRLTTREARPAVCQAPKTFTAKPATIIAGQRRKFTTTRAIWSANAPATTPAKKRGGSKVYKTADDAVADIKSGSTILSSGFGLCGVAGEQSQTPIPRPTLTSSLQKPSSKPSTNAVPTLSTLSPPSPTTPARKARAGSRSSQSPARSTASSCRSSATTRRSRRNI